MTQPNLPTPGSLWDNPLGTNGFEFIEYAAPDPAELGALFEYMGFVAVARHRSKEVLLYRQGDINFIVNAEPDSFAQSFARVHGPCICAIAFRVADAAVAYRRAVELAMPMLKTAFPLTGREALAALRRGEDPGANVLLMVDWHRDSSSGLYLP